MSPFARGASVCWLHYVDHFLSCLLLTSANRSLALLGGPQNSLAGTVFVPHTEDEYRRLVALLDGLIDEVGEDESHPLASLIEIVGVLIEKYEDERVPELSVE